MLLGECGGVWILGCLDFGDATLPSMWMFECQRSGVCGAGLKVSGRGSRVWGARLGIAESLYYSWSKEFLKAGKRWLSGDTARQATSPEVKENCAESLALRECVADLTLENRLLKKSMTGSGEFEE